MKHTEICRQAIRARESIHSAFSRVLLFVERSRAWSLCVSFDVNLQFRVTGLMIAILISGFVFSARLNYIHNFRLYDMSTYSYTQLAAVETSAKEKVYRELATKYLVESEDYRQAAARTTDMFVSSVIAVALLFVAILIGLVKRKHCRLLGCVTAFLVMLAFLFLVLTLVLWAPRPLLEPLRWGNLFPGMVRELPRWDFIDQIIQDTDYLQPVLRRK